MWLVWIFTAYLLLLLLQDTDSDLSPDQQKRKHTKSPRPKSRTRSPRPKSRTRSPRGGDLSAKSSPRSTPVITGAAGSSSEGRQRRHRESPSSPPHPRGVREDRQFTDILERYVLIYMSIYSWTCLCTYHILTPI